MDVLSSLLLVLAVVLCGLAGFRIGTPRIHFGWLGLTAALLAALVVNFHLQ